MNSDIRITGEQTLGLLLFQSSLVATAEMEELR